MNCGNCLMDHVMIVEITGNKCPNCGADYSAYVLKQKNIQAFMEHLTIEYTELFKNDPEYSYAANKISPNDLARKMTLGLDSGSANKDGRGITNTCKFFGIKNTYKAIREFLNKE